MNEIIMKCENCGRIFDISDNNMQCPYCGVVNTIPKPSVDMKYSKSSSRKRISFFQIIATVLITAVICIIIIPGYWKRSEGKKEQKDVQEAAKQLELQQNERTESGITEDEFDGLVNVLLSGDTIMISDNSIYNKTQKMTLAQSDGGEYSLLKSYNEKLYVVERNSSAYGIYLRSFDDPKSKNLNMDTMIECSVGRRVTDYVITENYKAYILCGDSLYETKMDNMQSREITECMQAVSAISVTPDGTNVIVLSGKMIYVFDQNAVSKFSFRSKFSLEFSPEVVFAIDSNKFGYISNGIFYLQDQMAGPCEPLVRIDENNAFSLIDYKLYGCLKDISNRSNEFQKGCYDLKTGKITFVE